MASYFSDDVKRIVGFVYAECNDLEAQSSASLDDHEFFTDMVYQEHFFYEKNKKYIWRMIVERVYVRFSTKIYSIYLDINWKLRKLKQKY